MENSHNPLKLYIDYQKLYFNLIQKRLVKYLRSDIKNNTEKTIKKFAKKQITFIYIGINKIKYFAVMIMLYYELMQDVINLKHLYFI